MHVFKITSLAVTMKLVNFVGRTFRSSEQLWEAVEQEWTHINAATLHKAEFSQHKLLSMAD